MLKDIIWIFPADSCKPFRFCQAAPVDNFFAHYEKRNFSSRFSAIFVSDIPQEPEPARVISPDHVPGECHPLSLNPKKPLMPMSVLNTDRVTVIRGKDPEAPIGGLRPTLSKTAEKKHKKNACRVNFFSFICKRDRNDPGAGAKGQGCEELPPIDCLR